MKSVFCLFLFTLSVLCVDSQIVKYNPSRLDSLVSLEERMLVVFITADWCKFCEMMKNSSFKNKEVVELLNEKYFFIELDEKYSDDVLFGNKSYKGVHQNNPAGKHELALNLAKLDGHYTLPGLCVFNKNSQVVFQHGGFLSAEELKKLLQSLN